MAFRITRTSSAFAGTDFLLTVEFNQTLPQFSQPAQAGQRSAFGKLTFLNEFQIDFETEQNQPGRVAVRQPNVFGDANLTFAQISYSSRGFTVRIPFGDILADAIRSSDTQLSYQLDIGLRKGFTPTASLSLAGSQLYPTTVNHLVGTNGNDLLTGSLFRNEVQGLGGSDLITTFGGDDLIAGGEGNDQINAGGGQNWVLGEGGNDQITVRGNFNLISGGAGIDRITGESFLTSPFFTVGQRSDQITGDEGNDILSGAGTLNGGDGLDLVNGYGVLNGDAGNDRLTSSNTQTPDATDRFSGGKGNDFFATSDGRDILDGGEGNDVLDAYSGGLFIRGLTRATDVDSLTGGAGSDQFVLGGQSDSFSSSRPFYLGQAASARLLDFSPQEDKIILQGISRQYSLVNTAVGTRILYSNPNLGIVNDEIAVLNGVSNLNLTAAYFVYI
ncbi:MAG: calcium-binding protein [Elainella sp.]